MKVIATLRQMKDGNELWLVPPFTHYVATRQRPNSFFFCAVLFLKTEYLNSLEKSEMNLAFCQMIL